MKPLKFGQRLLPEDIDQIIQLRLRGMTVQRIAIIMHREHNAVRDVIKQAGLVNVPVRR